MDNLQPANVLHWNYRGFTEFPLQRLEGEEGDVTDIYLKENLISKVPDDIDKLINLESLYLSGNDITELPKEISNLRCLKCLDISGNRLRHIPSEIGEMRNLKFLILDENELSELPLRVSELRALRYLSVCDNKLQWLPQRPVYNYHHCEFRFWRNKDLKCIPYSLWYHMFRGQQTRSLNIGCLNFPKYQLTNSNSRGWLKIIQNSLQWDVDITFPESHQNIIDYRQPSPPSLYELSKRIFYEMLNKAAREVSTRTSMYCDHNMYAEHYNNNMNNLQEHFQGFNINSEKYDLNGNLDTDVRNYYNMKKKKDYHVPADVIAEHFWYLPRFMSQELCNGPVTRCENIGCKSPIFDYVLYEFCVEKIILIGSTEDVILSAAFCSKTCADLWKAARSTLPWKLL